MSEMYILGLAALGVITPFGIEATWEAWKYRDHPLCEPKREAMQWGLLAICWALATAGAYYL